VGAINDYLKNFRPRKKSGRLLSRKLSLAHSQCLSYQYSIALGDRLKPLAGSGVNPPFIDQKGAPFSYTEHRFWDYAGNR
jgi:hypothetical protein